MVPLATGASSYHGASGALARCVQGKDVHQVGARGKRLSPRA